MTGPVATWWCCQSSDADVWGLLSARKPGSLLGAGNRLELRCRGEQQGARAAQSKET